MEEDAMEIVVALVALTIFGLFVKSAFRYGKLIEEAKEAYEKSLHALRKNPNDPTLRQETLRLARKYSSMSPKDKNGRREFDEVAIMNDINAAGAGAVSNVKIANPEVLSGKSITEEIEKLGKLFLAGALTAEEFERGKALFLGTPPNKAAAAVELLENLEKLRKQGALSEGEFNMKKWEILSERLLPRR